MKKKLRYCVRCGCTDARAWIVGCSWYFDEVDICSRCFNPTELTLIGELFDNITAAENDLAGARSDLRHAKRQWVLFVRLLKSTTPRPFSTPLPPAAGPG